MAERLTPHLMFTGRAQEAMDLYVDLFDGAEVLEVERHGPDGPGGPDAEGTVLLARIRLAGQELQCADSPPVHDFDFTPSLSLFVDCRDEAELERLFAGLADGGGVLMPLGDHGFSARFGWVSDRFGVSWQLNLPADAR